ncbi:hypothetical protein ACQJBY_070418 [Aegilops geniculata]
MLPLPHLLLVHIFLPHPLPGPAPHLRARCVHSCMTHTAMKKRRRHGQPHHLHLLVSLLLLPLLDRACAAPPSAPKMARIQQHLDRANKPALRTIQSMDGDTIDCVPRHKQHALDHPLLKNHRIQSAPPRMPASATATFRASAAASANSTSRARAAWQTWHHAGHCPKGTVPVRRTTAEDVLRGGQSLFRFGRKRHRRDRAARAANAPDVVTGNGHEHAIAYTAVGQQEVYGAKATINVWDPAIQEPNGFSLSQLWLLSGSFNGSDLNSIEAGWQSGQP